MSTIEKACPTCGHRQTFEACPECDGKGYILPSRVAGDSTYDYLTMGLPCRECRGTGIKGGRVAEAEA